MSTYITAAKNKCNKKTGKMFIDAILGGFMIASGGFASQVITATGLPKAVAAAVFSIGLVMVVLTGSELFTGNCLMVGGIVKGELSIKEVIYNWIIVYLGNLVGALLMAISVSVIGISEEQTGVIIDAANTKLSLSTPEMLVRGILCNVLVCIAVWMAVNVNETIGKVFCAALPVFVFVLCAFEHSVANMFFLPAAAMLQGHFYPAIIYQIAIVTIGNIIGGGLIGAALEFRRK